MRKTNDLGRDPVFRLVCRLAIPTMLAQLVSVLYSIVDRIYIGNIQGIGDLALAGVGVCGPIVTLLSSFASLVGLGGSPIMAMRMGEGRDREAGRVLSNSFLMLLILSGVLTTLFLLLKEHLLMWFGASDATFGYANTYLTIYTAGTFFALMATGMNSFLIAQGFSGLGMATVMLGAVLNIVLDPIFIFTFHMGVRGAALATILSQFLSALWIVKFLTGGKAILRLKTSAFRLKKQRVKNIVALGMSGFTMAITNSSVQIMYNASLQHYGGDLYVGIMTVINSVREIISMPVNGLTNSAQPVMGFNYGAGEYKRVKRAIVFISVVSIAYTKVMWLFVHGFPEFFIRIFNQDADLVREGIPAMRIYYFGFFMMSLQFAGQSVFVALGKAKNAVFFSIFRKVIIVIPLMLVLPLMFGLGTDGVLMAEPVSNFIGGAG